MKPLKRVYIFSFFLSFVVYLSAQTSLTVTEGTPTLDGVISDGEWTSEQLVTNTTNITLQAMTDDEYLYIVASWSDATTTESIAKKQWTYDGTSWSQTGNEDRLGIIWDMGLNGTDGANCATMCHSGVMSTITGKVDVWHWKAARGNPMGFVDDKNWETDGRHSDSGTSTYSDNSSMGSGYPTYMATGDPGAGVDFLVDTTEAENEFDPYGILDYTVAVAVDFDSTATFETGATIPGYVLRIPEGDRSSVQSAGKYDSGVWTVEFKRALAGGDNDFAVVSGSSVDFTIEKFDDEGGDHPDDGFDATIYKLEFPPSVGVEEISVTGLPHVYSLNQNHPNPFNPVTTIGYHLPEQSHVSISVYDILGKRVRNLVEQTEEAGYKSISWDATNENGQPVSAGIYLYQIKAGEFIQTRKMAVLK